MLYVISLIDIIMKNLTALTWGVGLGVLLALFLFSNGIVMSLLPSRVNYWQQTNVIPLLQRKTADTAHTGIFVGVTRPLSQFLGGARGQG